MIQIKIVVNFVWPFLLLCSLKSEAKMEQDSKWFKCEKNTDCIVIQGICSNPTSINRKYEKEAKAYYHWRGTADSCAGPELPKAESVPSCRAGKCVTLSN